MTMTLPAGEGQEVAREDIRPHAGQMTVGLRVRLQRLADDFAEPISDQSESVLRCPVVLHIVAATQL